MVLYQKKKRVKPFFGPRRKKLFYTGLLDPLTANQQTTSFLSFPKEWRAARVRPAGMLPEEGEYDKNFPRKKALVPK